MASGARIMIVYTPFRKGGESPADKRRFILWAKNKGLNFKYSKNILGAVGSEIYIYPTNSDISMEDEFNKFNGYRIVQIVDGYLSAREHFLTKWARGIAKFISGETSYLKINYDALLKKNIRQADLVICASVEQAIKLRELNQRVSVIPDNHSEFYRTRTQIDDTDEVVLIWEGMGHSLKHLSVLEDVFEELENRGINWRLQIFTDLRYKKYANTFLNINAISDIRKHLPNFQDRLTLIQWSEGAILNLANKKAIGLVPIMTNDNLANMKHECKLLLFWQVGLPTLQTPIPSYMRVSNEAGLKENLVQDRNAWVTRILELSELQEFNRVKKLQDYYINSFHTLEIYLKKWDNAIYGTEKSIEMNEL